MADSRTWTGKRRRWWPLLLGLLVVLAFIWLLVQAGEHTQPSGAPQTPAIQEPVAEAPPFPDEEPAPPTASEVAQAVDAYVQFTRSPSSGTPLDRDRISRGISLLSNALEALAEHTREARLLEPRDALRRQAAIVQQSLAREDNAAVVRDAALAAADLMAALEQQRAPVSSETLADVRSAAETIRPAEPIPQQHDALEAFFEHAREMLLTLEPSRK